MKRWTGLHRSLHAKRNCLFVLVQFFVVSFSESSTHHHHYHHVVLVEQHIFHMIASNQMYERIVRLLLRVIFGVFVFQWCPIMNRCVEALPPCVRMQSALCTTILLLYRNTYMPWVFFDQNQTDNAYCEQEKKPVRAKGSLNLLPLLASVVPLNRLDRVDKTQITQR